MTIKNTGDLGWFLCLKPLLSGFLILLTNLRFLLLLSRLLIHSRVFLTLNKLVSKRSWKHIFLIRRVNVRIWLLYNLYISVSPEKNSLFLVFIDHLTPLVIHGFENRFFLRPESRNLQWYMFIVQSVKFIVKRRGHFIYVLMSI